MALTGGVMLDKTNTRLHHSAPRSPQQDRRILLMTGEFSPSPVRVIHGAGAFAQLGAEAGAMGLSTVLIVSDMGIMKAGHAVRAVQLLTASVIGGILFLEVQENPTTANVTAGVEVARRFAVNGFVALGGGSAMDCAKAINLIYTNGGDITQYEGEGKANQRLLPLIAVPTTAGTGSEAQSFALISDANTHRKMVIGDRRLPQDGGIRPHLAILDSELTATAPHRVAVLAGLDAMSHAIETAGTTAQMETSRAFSKRAWDLLNANIEAVIRGRPDGECRHAMLLGAHLAGLAIEHSMLGAAHSCANPLTARFGITHGLAVAIMLPHVIRFNAESGDRPYQLLQIEEADLANRIDSLLQLAQLPVRLRDLGIAEAELSTLASEAALQWTARFNPRLVDADDLLTIYQRAL